jgi:hypothetical protein
MSEEREPDWLVELVKGGRAIRREVEPIVEAARQFVRDAQRACESGSATLPFAQRVALAVDAGIREFLPSAPLHATVYPQTVAGSVAIPTPIVGSGSLALPRVGFSGQGTVENRAGGLAALSDGQVVFLVIVWLFAVIVPVLGSALPLAFHALLSDSVATFAFALSVTWRIRDSSK